MTDTTTPGSDNRAQTPQGRRRQDRRAAKKAKKNHLTKRNEPGRQSKPK